MPLTRTVTNTATKAVSSAETQPGPKSPTALLGADQQAASELFAGVEMTRSARSERAGAAEPCAALSVHAQIEEEIVDSAVHAALKYKSLVPEAAVEHTGVKDLIAQIERALPGGEAIDAKVKVPSEVVMHFVEEAQVVMLPRVKASATDMLRRAVRPAACKDELLAQAA